MFRKLAVLSFATLSLALTVEGQNPPEGRNVVAAYSSAAKSIGNE